MIFSIVLSINIFSSSLTTSIAMQYNDILFSFNGSNNYNKYLDNYNITLITNEKIYTIGKETYMNKSQDKIDKRLQSIIEKSATGNEKVPIIISLNKDFNENKILEKLKRNITSLDIKPTIEDKSILEGPVPIIFASINATDIKLLKNIPEVKLIEYDGKTQISN